MLTIGGASPYTAVLRRTPALLPGMKCPPDETGTVARDSQRMREISIQKITETTSRERTNRALRTLTKPAGEEIRYQLGDEREYWQEPSRKTALGWTGTGVVCDLTRLGRGVIGVRTSSDRVITRFIKQVRPILAYWELFREGPDDPAYWAVLLLVHLVGQLARGLQLTLGQARQDGLWIAIRETRTHAGLLDAARAVAELHFQLTTDLAARISTGTNDLKARSEFSSSFLFWWTSKRPSSR